MAACILPRICRGRLYFQVADSFFPIFAQTVAARAAVEANCLGIFEPVAEPIADLGLTLVVGGVAWTL